MRICLLMDLGMRRWQKSSTYLQSFAGKYSFRWMCHVLSTDFLVLKWGIELDFIIHSWRWWNREPRRPWISPPSLLVAISWRLDSCCPVATNTCVWSWSKQGDTIACCCGYGAFYTNILVDNRINQQGFKSSSHNRLLTKARETILEVMICEDWKSGQVERWMMMINQFNLILEGSGDKVRLGY